MEIGADSMMMAFPTKNTLLHHVVSCVAINQDWQKPNRWVNKIIQKLIDTDITSIEILKSIIDKGNLNECLDDYDVPWLHAITISGVHPHHGHPGFSSGPITIKCPINHIPDWSNPSTEYVALHGTSQWVNEWNDQNLTSVTCCNNLRIPFIGLYLASLL